MKLTSKLRRTNSFKITETVFSENCSLAQAFTMIESWCYDNGANYPTTKNISKTENNVRVQVKTVDDNYINISDKLEKISALLKYLFFISFSFWIKMS